MKLRFISEEFALTVLEAAINRTNSVTAPEKLEGVVARAVQICIDADRATEAHLSARLRVDTSK